MNHVLYAWLVVGELHAEPDRVGVAQMFFTLPALAGLLFAGAVADRRNRRKLLMALCTALAILVAGMASIVGAQILTFGILFGYAAGWGLAHAFFLPTQEAMLADVAGPDLMRAVTVRTLVQFAALALGNLVGGSARWIGTETALVLQSCVLLVGFVPFYWIRGVHQEPPGTPSRTLVEIRDGLRTVAASQRLRPLTLLVASWGFFSIGPWFVLVPLMVRDIYQGDVGVLALAMMMFPLGSMLGSTALLLRGGIHRKGLALVVAFVVASSCLAAESFEFSLPVFLALLFAWGVSGSVFLNTSRTLFQEGVPISHRARVFSVYILGFMGMAPLGNLASGFVADRIGAPGACAVAGLGAVAVAAVLAWRTRIPQMR
jgi:MFS family permease